MSKLGPLPPITRAASCPAFAGDVYANEAGFEALMSAGFVPCEKCCAPAHSQTADTYSLTASKTNNHLSAANRGHIP